METLSFPSSDGQECVQLFRLNNSAKRIDQEEVSFFTVTSTEDASLRSTCHQALDQDYKELFASTTTTLRLELGEEDEQTLWIENDVKADNLRKFLEAKLLAAFRDKAIRIECFVSCARVTVGGFGAAWHHDATSQLTFDGVVCDYLAVYYLEPYDEKGNHWLEIAMVEEDVQVSEDNFLPACTATHSLLVLRNDQILHRTPLLSQLIRDGGVRRFFYVPFRVLKNNRQSILVQASASAEWEAYSDTNSGKVIQDKILTELNKHNDDCLDFNNYVKGTVTSGDDKTASVELRAERTNWLFDDPDDY